MTWDNFCDVVKVDSEQNMNTRPITQFIEQYLVWLKMSRRPDTIQGFKTGLLRFSRWMKQEEITLNSLNITDIPEYLNFLEEEGLAQKTRAVYVCALRSFWKWLSTFEELPFDVESIPALSQDSNYEKEVATENDYRKMIHGIDDFFPIGARDKAIIAFLFATGVRVGELCSMNTQDVDIENMHALVKTGKRKNHFRRVYWNPEIGLILEHWFKMRERIIDKRGLPVQATFFALDSNHFGNRLHRASVARLLRKSRDKAGIKRPITAHSFRHGFATRAVRKNVNMRYLREMMGHKKFESTLVYARAENEECQNEYKRMFG